MKTYQSGTKEKRKNFFSRHKNAVIAIASVLVVATVVTLSIVLTRPKDVPVVDNVEEPPIQNVVVEPKYVLPMSGATTGLGYAHERLVYWDTLEVWKTHDAIDFVGEGDVLAICDGTVTDVEMHTTLDGNVVTVTHADGYVSVYKSLGDNVSVKVGDKVKSGDKIGVASNSMLSELNTGAHLHLEVKKDGKPVDPTTVIPLNEDK